MKIGKNRIRIIEFLVGGTFIVILFLINSKMKTDNNFQIDKASDVGLVELNVKDLFTMKEFYTKLVGLEVITETDQEVSLGMGSVEVIKLIENRSLDAPTFNSAGLYHNAILFSDRGKLAHTVERILTQNPQSYSGSADHLVSIAFYFTDPEGNGLELYIDRPRSDWKWNVDKVVMSTLYVDAEKFIQDSGEVLSDELKLGHVHLKVGNITEAKMFYHEILGFDVVALLPSAMFFSAGGYHHHIGTNTWESSGAGVRGNTLGLNRFEIKLSSEEELKRMEENLSRNDVGYEIINESIELKDPWGNGIRIIK